MPRLENWAVVDTNDPYTPPELRVFSLHGNVFGHNRFPDMQEITTSFVTHVDKDKKEVTTYSGSVYVLGQVNPEYEKMFPGAENRFFNSVRR